jgi:rod shape-determining protein MreD
MRTLLVLTVFGGGVAQATLGSALRFADVAPDIPLIMVVLLALRRGPEIGCAAGLAAGLLQDAATGGLIGVQGLTKALIGFVVGVLGARFSVRHPLVEVPGLVLLTLVEAIVRYGLLQLFRFPAPFGQLMTYVVLPQAVYNGFLGAAFVFALAGMESLRARLT